MKRIELMIIHEHLDRITAALHAIGIEDVTVSDVKNFSGENVRPPIADWDVKCSDFREKIELFVEDDQADEAVQAIQRAMPRAGNSHSRSRQEEMFISSAKEYIDHGYQ